MYLNHSRPELSANTQTRIDKIRSLIPIQCTWLKNIERFAGRTKKILMIILLCPPYVLQKILGQYRFIFVHICEMYSHEYSSCQNHAILRKANQIGRASCRERV